MWIFWQYRNLRNLCVIAPVINQRENFNMEIWIAYHVKMISLSKRICTAKIFLSQIVKMQVIATFTSWSWSIQGMNKSNRNERKCCTWWDNNSVIKFYFSWSFCSVTKRIMHIIHNSDDSDIMNKILNWYYNNEIN